MTRKTTRKAMLQATALSTAVLLLGAAGGAYAAIKHEAIPLKNAAGVKIPATGTGSDQAYSIKTTCFGTTGCHGTVGAADNTKYTYDDIEKHSYHAQIGANEFRGFNPANPDSDDAFRSGVGPQGKNWVQSPGHMGSW